MPTQTVADLRHTDRKRLLRYLTKLGAPVARDRAAAARAADKLLQAKGIPWASLVPAGPNDAADDSDGPALDWRALAFQLSECADLSPSDRTYALKLTRWRAPGSDGLVRLREMARQVGLGLD